MWRHFETAAAGAEFEQGGAPGTGLSADPAVLQPQSKQLLSQQVQGT